MASPTQAFKRVKGKLVPKADSLLKTVIAARPELKNQHGCYAQNVQNIADKYFSTTLMFDDCVVKAPNSVVESHWPEYIEQEKKILDHAHEAVAIPKPLFSAEGNDVYFGMEREKRGKVGRGYLYAGSYDVDTVVKFMIDFGEAFTQRDAKRIVRVNAGYTSATCEELRKALKGVEGMRLLDKYPKLRSALTEHMDVQSSSPLIVFHNDIAARNIMRDRTILRIVRFIDLGCVYKGSPAQVLESLRNDSSHNFYDRAVEGYNQRTGRNVTQRDLVLSRIASNFGRLAIYTPRVSDNEHTLSAALKELENTSRPVMAAVLK